MRREPQLSAGDAVEARMAAERLAHRKELLADLLASEAWTHVLRPALIKKADRIATMLASDTERSLETIRGQQGTWRGLMAIANLSVDDLESSLSE